MNTQTKTPAIETTPSAPVRRGLSQLRYRVATVVASVAFIIAGSAGGAFATTSTDPLNGGGDSIFTTLQGYLTGSLVGKVFALAVVSIAIGLVLRWVRKAVHA